jgi:hypothetical protein
MSRTCGLKSTTPIWNEILRLATSIKQGTVTASLMPRKLGSYPRQNGLAVALSELGRIERTLFILSWPQSVDLRRRVNAGLNMGEARNALARAVFFCRLGEIRDRSFEQQRYRASELTLVTAAIAQWNTVYIDRAVQALATNGTEVNPELLKYLSPLGWETSPAITNGTAKDRLKGDSGRFGLKNILSVFCFPFLTRPHNRHPMRINGRAAASRIRQIIPPPTRHVMSKATVLTLKTITCRSFGGTGFIRCSHWRGSLILSMMKTCLPYTSTLNKQDTTLRGPTR